MDSAVVSGNRPNPYGADSGHRAGDDWDGNAAFRRDDLESKPTFRPKRASTPIQAALDKLLKSMPNATIDAKIGCTNCGQDHVRQGKRTCNAHSRRATPLRPCRNFPPHGLASAGFTEARHRRSLRKPSGAG